MESFWTQSLSSAFGKLRAMALDKFDNDGPGTMASAFQSFPFGFGMAITFHVLQKGNELRIEKSMLTPAI